MVSRRLLAGVFVVVAGWALLGAGVEASSSARMIADEPQYVLSAISLAEDGDLDVSDELADERWRDFHRAELPRQTEPLDDGSELSPHDPLLPVLLAPLVGTFGWVGARITMALVAGALASLLVWTAVVRLGVRLRPALVVVGAFSCSAPLSAYGSQIYPELVAALAVTVAVAALLGHPSRARTAAWVVAVVALPWLGVKYAGVAAALAAVGLWRETRPPNSTRGPSDSDADFVENGRGVAAVAGLSIAGVTYLLFHRAVYGGWTVYAAGDHFVGGELTVVGSDPDHVGRTIRLLGLLVDRDFGLVAWAPVYLLAIPALAALASRGPDRALLLAPLAAGYATATWVALTMHGFWWPGRQTVVVLPIVVLAAARFVDGRRRLVLATLVAGVVGASTWLWVVVEATSGPLTLILGFDETANPWVRTWRLFLPDERTGSTTTVVLNAAWAAVVLALGIVGWRDARRGDDVEDAVLSGS